MSPSPRGDGSCPSSAAVLKGDFQPFFFFFPLGRGLWLCVPHPAWGGSAAPPVPPQAQAPAPLPRLFLPAGITSEQVTFPEGRCHARGAGGEDSHRYRYPGHPSGCEIAVAWRWQPVKRVLEGLPVA